MVEWPKYSIILAYGAVESGSGFGAFLHEWQSLIAGCLGFFGGLIGGGFLYWQIRQVRALEHERNTRRRAAVRAALPLVLSDVAGYAIKVGRELGKIHSNAVGNRVQPSSILSWEVPCLPSGTAAALSEAIESGSNEVADTIAKLLTEIQIQVSRLRSLKADVSHDKNNHIVVQLNIEGYIIDAADLHARCIGLFKYARRETESVQSEFTQEDRFRAISLMRLSDNLEQELIKRLAN